MTSIQFKNYKKASMIRVEAFLAKSQCDYPRKQNQKIRTFAKMNNLVIPINKSNIDWLIELYLSKQCENCSQEVEPKRNKPLVKKTINRFGDDFIYRCRLIDESIDAASILRV